MTEQKDDMDKIERKIRHHCVMKKEWGKIEERLINIQKSMIKDYEDLVKRISDYSLRQTIINQKHDELMSKFSVELHENGFATKLALNDKQTELIEKEVDKIKRSNMKILFVIFTAILGLLAGLILK